MDPDQYIEEDNIKLLSVSLRLNTDQEIIREYNSEIRDMYPEMVSLVEVLKEFRSLGIVQGEHLDTIEDNLRTAEVNVNEAEKSLESVPTKIIKVLMSGAIIISSAIISTAIIIAILI